MRPEWSKSGPWPHALLVAALLFVQGSVAGLAFAQTPNADAPDPDAARQAERLAAGQRIYREGLLSNGEPLTAVGAAQARLSGQQVACVACHRRSGYGGSEGGFVVRPITGPALLQQHEVAVHSPRIKAQLGVRIRPPYTEDSLVRALRDGVDAAGKPLSPLMPRYALGEADAKALASYLFQLSASPSPGVDGQEIHFATVIQPGVSDPRRRAMLDIMQAFVKDKDANARQEEQRREAGTMRMYRAYRKWVLHVWELDGPSESWPGQLERFYREQPVFALVGGIGERNWQPIHDFCERLQIPALLPLTPVPAVAGSNHYTIYFSRGVMLEAGVLAGYLDEQPAPTKVVQVYRADDAGRAAAAALRSAYKSAGRGTLLDEVLEGRADVAFWSRVTASAPDAVVAWLPASDLDEALPLAGAAASPVYLSFSQLAGSRPEKLLKTGAEVRLVYPSDLPPRHESRVLRNRVWLHGKGIAIGDEALQVNTLFAMTVVSDVLGHMAGDFSRDYFVERAEHTLGQTPMASIFPQIGLGPGQRFAAKGASIVQWVDGAKPGLKAVSGWIVP